MADPLVARNAISYLCGLIHEHAHNENWLEAIRAYHAVLSYKHPPEEEAKYRVGLARIRLSHTLDRDIVKKELDHACLLLARKPAHLRLHMEALETLARYHTVQGDWRPAQEACLRALNLWHQNDDTAVREKAKDWVPHLHLHLAAACPTPCTDAERQLAINSLQQGLHFAAAHHLPQHQVLIHLQLVHHSLRQPELGAWDPREADEKLRALAVALLPLQQSTQPSVFTTQATLHFKILQMAVAAKKGTLSRDHLEAARLGDQPPFMLELQRIAAALQPHPPPYDWLPLRAQMAWAYLMAATALRMRGWEAPTATYLEQGLQEATLELWHMGVAGEGGMLSKEAFSQQGVDSAAHARALVALVALLHLQRAHLHLSDSTNLAAAQQSLLSCLHILATFGRSTGLLLPQAHLMLALYAHEAGEHEAAEAHCDRVLLLADTLKRGPALETQARCLKALAALASGAPNRASRAADALGDLYPLTHNHEGASAADGASQLVASALTCLAAGHEQEALNRLRRTLNPAIRTINNNHLVVMILTTMAPLQLKLKGDWDGARTMLDTAASIGDATRDLLLRLGTARAKLAFEEQCVPRQHDRIQQLQAKVATWEQRLAMFRHQAAAADHDAHRHLLAWDVALAAPA